MLWADDYDTGDPLETVTAVSLKCALPARPSVAPVTVGLTKAPDGSWTSLPTDPAGFGLGAVTSELPTLESLVDGPSHGQLAACGS